MDRRRMRIGIVGALVFDADAGTCWMLICWDFERAGCDTDSDAGNSNDRRRVFWAGFV